MIITIIIHTLLFYWQCSEPVRKWMNGKLVTNVIYSRAVWWFIYETSHHSSFLPSCLILTIFVFASCLSPVSECVLCIVNMYNKSNKPSSYKTHRSFVRSASTTNGTISTYLLTDFHETALAAFMTQTKKSSHETAVPSERRKSREIKCGSIKTHKINMYKKNEINTLDPFHSQFKDIK